MPTFPAPDEEPPPRPVWKVLVMVTAGVVSHALAGKTGKTGKTA